MSLKLQDQKLIYDFLTSAIETIEGFRTSDDLEFTYNPNLEKLTIESLEATSREKSPASRFEPHNQVNDTTKRLTPSLTTKVKPSTAAPITVASAQPNHNVNASIVMPPTPPEITEAFTQYISPQDLKALSNTQYEVSQCTACKLAQSRKSIVFGEGCFTINNTQTPGIRPTVLVIGEAPGANEDATARPFVGRAGQLLDKMLASIDLFRSQNCYICNVVKCRPPNNRQPEADEVAACLPYLYQQIKLIRPKFILLLGRTACHALLDTSYGINAIHGKWFEVLSIPAMCTYHPSALLHDESLKRPVWEDLKLFKQRLNKQPKE